jgi:nucleotide-binding universal stress UspA family protein
VIVGVDGSDEATAAADWAAEEAGLRHWSVVLVHVCEAGGIGHPDPCLDGHHLLATATAVVIADHPDAVVSTRLLHGRVEDWLRAESRDVEMAVVGSRKMGQLRQAVLGTVTMAMAADTAAPVTIVHASSSGRKDGPVVVGCDTDGSSDAAIDLAFAEARSRAVDLLAVHSWRNTLAETAFPYVPPLMLDLSQLESEARQALSDTLSTHVTRYPDVRVRKVVTSEGPVPALLEHSETAQLVVVGTRNRGPMSGLVLGSTSQAVATHGHCPVVVVPPAEPAAVTR